MIQNIIDFIRGSGTVAVMVATPVFMLANIVGGLIISDFKEKFDPEILKASLIKYAAILIMSGLLLIGGKLSTEALLEAAGITIGFDIMVTLGIATVGGKYAKDAIEKYIEIVGLKVTRANNTDTLTQTVNVKLDADTLVDGVREQVDRIENLQKEGQTYEQ